MSRFEIVMNVITGIISLVVACYVMYVKMEPSGFFHWVFYLFASSLVAFVIDRFLAIVWGFIWGLFVTISKWFGA